MRAQQRVDGGGLAVLFGRDGAGGETGYGEGEEEADREEASPAGGEDIRDVCVLVKGPSAPPRRVKEQLNE